MKTMKFAIAWIVANWLYHLGDLVCRILHLPEKYHRAWWVGPVYQTYQKIMSQSLAVNDWGNAGIWKPSQSVE